MARYVTLPKELVASPIIYGKKPCASYSAFGSGQFEYFGVSGTFTVPNDVSRIRVTAVGAGGAGSCGFASGCCNCPQVGGNGGGGGGYVFAEVDVTSGNTCTITVGAFPGGTTCMGSQVVAFGGCNATCASNFTCQYGQISGFGCTGCAGAGGTTSTSNVNVSVLLTANGSFGGRGICGTKDPLFCCFRHNCTVCCSMCFHCMYLAGRGGAAGSYLGTSVCSEFPGTLCADVFACKGFNGESVAINDMSVPIVKPRWPGEFIISTSRSDSSIAGTAAGYPCPTYIASVFGGANSVSCCCESTIRVLANAGCGGGAAGGAISPCAIKCLCNYNCNIFFCCPCGCCCSAMYCGCGGNGYFVVEY